MPVNAINSYGIEQVNLKEATNKSEFSKVQSYPNDSYDFTTKTQNNGEKVSFSEGAKIIGKGFVNKVKEIAKSIIQHPIKTIGIAAGTAGAIALLPLIGISSAVGASALAVGFAGLAIGKTVSHTIKAIKHNNNGEYNNLRNDLNNIGGDCVDLAMSAPFLPKAVKTIRNNIKYGPSVGFNVELFNNIKNAKGIGAKYLELQKGNLRINYEAMSNEMGLKVKPKLVFDDKMPSDLKCFMAGEYEPTTGILKVNPKMLNKKMQILLKTNPEEILKHELTHFQQFADIARTEGVGVNGLENLITKYYTKAEAIGAIPTDKAALADNLLHGDKSLFNRALYDDIVKNTETITKGSPEATLAQSYADGLIAKVTTQIDEIKALNLGMFPTAADMKKVAEIYKKNPLEKPAFAAQDAYAASIKMRPGTIADVVMAETAATKNKKQ